MSVRWISQAEHRVHPVSVSDNFLHRFIVSFFFHLPSQPSLQLAVVHCNQTSRQLPVPPCRHRLVPPLSEPPLPQQRHWLWHQPPQYFPLASRQQLPSRLPPFRRRLVSPLSEPPVPQRWHCPH